MASDTLFVPYTRVGLEGLLSSYVKKHKGENYQRYYKNAYSTAVSRKYTGDGKSNYVREQRSILCLNTALKELSDGQNPDTQQRSLLYNIIQTETAFFSRTLRENFDSNTNVVVQMLMFLFSVVMVFWGLVVFLADKGMGVIPYKFTFPVLTGVGVAALGVIFPGYMLVARMYANRSAKVMEATVHNGIERCLINCSHTEQIVEEMVQRYIAGTGLSQHSQEELDEIAFSLNRRPRQRFGFRCPIEVLTEVMQKEMALSDNGSASIH